MAKQLQLRRGTTAQHSTFTGAAGEVTLDTDKDVVVVHDGTTAGGFPSQKELISGTNIKTINNSTILGSGNMELVSAGMITGGTTNQVLAKNSNTDYDTKWYSVQEPLVSGTNIKTVNSTSLLGSGDISVPQLSGVTAYHLLEGSLALASTTPTSGFSTTLYTGNGSTQSINTGVDMATQWGSDTTEVYGGLVWLKQRSGTQHHNLFDSTRAIGNRVYTNLNYASDTSPTTITSFNDNGFSLSTDIGTNTNAATYASWNFQTTHRISGTTNHGKAYTCHYNPYTGFTMVQYTGSGLAGHEIPHHLGRKLGFVTVKNLTSAVRWQSFTDSHYMFLNETTTGTTPSNNTLLLGDTISTLKSNNNETNTASNQYILYGWANSYYDEANTLIGNYEVGVYQGTGAGGNKVKTRGKPAWVMVKRLDSTGNWAIHDNARGINAWALAANLSSADGSYAGVSVSSDGFILQDNNTDRNTSGGQYLYMVVYDNDSGSGKSKYPKPADNPVINLTAKVPFANGVDVNGTKLSILNKNESISGVTLSQGKNYVYCDNTGAYGKSTVAPSYGVTNPASGGDFFNLNTFKWYTSAGTEITNSRNYLDAIVYGDTSGNAEYIEQLPKTVYYDRVKANRYEGKNACTAWVNFDGTTTPPTIRDSYNVSSVVRTATGRYTINFLNAMDNNLYSFTISGEISHDGVNVNPSCFVMPSRNILPTTSNISVEVRGTDGTNYNAKLTSIQIFGGKN